VSEASVDAYRAGLAPDTLAMVDALRGMAAGARPGLEERIKWNAPSFALYGEDRITLGVAPKGGVRVVLHRGAKAKTPENFRFDDPDGLAKWPAPDRGVATFADVEQIEAKRQQLSALFMRWLEVAA
jgi:hypothetical protein